MFKKVLFISMAVIFTGLYSCDMQGEKEKKAKKALNLAEKDKD